MNDRLIVSMEPDPVSDVLPEDLPCPKCKAGPDRRVLSAGFGEPHPICGKCGCDLRVGASNGDR